MGNHERTSHYFEDIFHEGAPYYSFDWGNSHITVIDSELASRGLQRFGPQCVLGGTVTLD